MLKIKLLNEQATLNNFSYLDVKEYIPALPLKINIQIADSETKQRLIPKLASKLNAIFQQRDGTSLTVSASQLFPDDRSMWQIALTGAQTVEIIGGNVQFDLDFEGDSTEDDLSDATDLRSGMGYSILAKITFDGEC